MGEQRGALVELVGADLREGTRHGGMYARPSLTELRAIGDLVRQRVLESVPALRVRRRLIDELRQGERPQCRRHVRL